MYYSILILLLASREITRGVYSREESPVNSHFFFFSTPGLRSGIPFIARRSLTSPQVAADSTVVNGKEDVTLVEARRQKRLMKKALRAQGGNATVVSETVGANTKETVKPVNVKDVAKDSKSSDTDVVPDEKEKHRPEGTVPIRKVQVPQQAAPFSSGSPAATTTTSQQLVVSVRKNGQVPQQASAPAKVEDTKSSSSTVSRTKVKSSIMSKPDLIPGTKYLHESSKYNLNLCNNL